MIRTTHTYVELPLSLGAFTEIKELMASAGYDHAFNREGDKLAIDMEGIAVIVAEPETPTHTDRKRVMAIEPSPCTDVLAGTFILEHESGSTEELDFYVRTCRAPDEDDPEFERYMSKRMDDLNEQYTDVASMLLLQYRRIDYQTVEPNPFI